MRNISKFEMERRKMKSTAMLRLSEAMLAITNEVDELYYSEWLAILADEQRRIIGLMLVEDWREDES